MTDTVIHAEELAYTYTAGERALKGIDLEIKRGEYIVIVGANGAGKTTFCLHMNGILPVMLGGTMEGSFYVLGKEPCEQRVYDVALHVGMVLQDPEAQLFSSDVVTEVAFAAENRNVSREEMFSLIDWALNIVRLSDYREASPADLSGGQKQRLAIAANLVIRPEILVLDEPTSQLDPIGTSEVFSTLNELNKDFGMTIVVTTHKTDQIVEFADRIVVLDKGNLIDVDTPRRVFFDVARMREALIHVPEMASIDHQIRKFTQGKLETFVKEEGANVNVRQTKDVVVKGIKSGIIKPSKSFKKGLGRSVRESVADENVEPILKIKNVSYRYNKEAPLALDNINLSVRSGEVLGIIGQNGAGKTTLMKCIVNLLKPDEGMIEFKGTDVRNFKKLELAKLIGLIMQNPDNQLFQMSTEEEIAFGLKNMNLPEDEIKQRIDEALELTGIEEHRELYPFKLSLGDRRKLAVASIYAMHPSILIFDEPTTGQDFRGRYQLCDLAIRLNQLGATIIMISHDMSLIARYTQRTLVMGKSKLLLDVPTREVFSHSEVLSSTFLEPPPAIQLVFELEGYGVPKDILTIEELYNFLTSEVHQNIFDSHQPIMSGN